jgi:hypothetical protein
LKNHTDDPEINMEYTKFTNVVEELPTFAERIAREKKEAREEGLEKGIDLGLIQGEEKMILKYYNGGTEIEFIAKVSGYSIDKIKEIINKR